MKMFFVEKVILLNLFENTNSIEDFIPAPGQKFAGVWRSYESLRNSGLLVSRKVKGALFGDVKLTEKGIEVAKNLGQVTPETENQKTQLEFLQKSFKN